MNGDAPSSVLAAVMRRVLVRGRMMPTMKFIAIVIASAVFLG
jgi:hypothetical protein